MHAASSCYGNEDQGVMIAAASDSIWNNGGACGQMYQVTCLSGTNEGTPFPCSGTASVVLKIVDYCPPPGCRGTLDLSQEAFSSIADPNSGKINISYQQTNGFFNQLLGVVFPSYYSETLKKSEMLVGSRPPGCVNKCSNCRPCIATLVIPPHERKDSRASYDKDDSYYLLTWKCKCGNKLFQP
ncbi:hypothetical protein F0562_007319 [Nyssa sinensis]|uniref:Expansin-like EG45 domain-containing protein n=1 Tax=Nyssa sinensis TaxID=561372 RepID=A0A5J5A5K1_9ASTE|nr:hypothetical protein F0562_007319 [Nyssa sinensis]